MKLLNTWALCWPLSVATALFAPNFQAVFGGGQIGAVAVDAAGNIYVADSTTAANISVTPSAFQRTFTQSICGYIPGPHGSQGPPVYCSHGFVAKVDPSAKQILWATYLGGECQDFISAICADTAGTFM